MPINLLLFNDDAAADDTPISFDTPALLQRLAAMRAEETMVALRRGVHALKRDACAAGSALRSESDECIVFTLRHLCAELDQIAASQTLERARYYLDRFTKSVSETRTSAINDINLNRWKEYDDILTDSLWLIDRRDNTGVHTAGYWGNFIPQIPHQMLRRYTKPGDWVLDTFAGSGTTLIEAQRLGRNSIGSELQEHVAQSARALLNAEPNEHNVASEIVVGDSAHVDYRAALERYGRSSVQLVMMHPPYYDIIKFSGDQRDLSNAASVDAFLAMMVQITENAAAVLDKGRYLALVIGDKYEKGEWIPLGFQTMNVVQQCGFLLKSIVVKNFEETTGKRQQKELWKYRALAGGFYVFKHEYIFVLKKR